MLKKILVICLFFILFFTPGAFAADEPTQGQEFATNYDVAFDVSEDGIATVTEKIVLRNLTSRYFANQFKLIIGATRITDISASDNGGPMEVKSEQKDNATTISVKFNQQVAGLNKLNPWTLKFKSKDFAEKQGKIWEVRAPKISSSANLENYNLTISVPSEFGEPTLIAPTPRSQTTNFGKIFLTFDKSQLLKSGISASFGTNQLFDFDLSYHLQNPGLVPVLTNIALPPDTEYQDVIFQRLDPKPINVTLDEDGNYLAWYRLNRNQKIDIKLIGSAKLYTYSKIANPSLPDSLKEKYTKSDKYWEKDNPQIKSKLTEILGDSPPENNLEKAGLIYHYVVDSLKYDSSRLSNNIERLGAVTALNNPNSAVCMEFTDLFIALSRAAGIPARELNGFAYSSNSTLRPLSLSRDILHSWPEIWDDKKGWIMVDPTWENTTGGVDYFNKLDLNHFVFVTKGVSSQQPVPAGSYKYTNVDSHDVKVSLTENDFLGKPQLDASIQVSDPILAGFPAKIKLVVTNLGDGLFVPANFTISSKKLQFLQAQTRQMGPIPPFGSVSYEFDVRTGSIMDSYQDNIEVMIKDRKITKPVTVRAFLVFQRVPLAILAGGSIIGVVYFLILGGYIHKNRKKRA